MKPLLIFIIAAIMTFYGVFALLDFTLNVPAIETAYNVSDTRKLINSCNGGVTIATIYNDKRIPVAWEVTCKEREL